MLSRSFVRQALLSPPTGFSNEITWYYLVDDKVQDVIVHARRLMDKTAGLDKEERSGASWDADAIGSLTAGAKLSLQVSRTNTQVSTSSLTDKRTVERLETIRREHRELLLSNE